MQNVDGDLTPAEQELCAHVVRGTMADYAQEERVDASSGASWGPARTVRAEKLRDLITGGVSGISVHWRGVRIRGAKITGTLDLETANVPYPLAMIGCWFENP